MKSVVEEVFESTNVDNSFSKNWLNDRQVIRDASDSSWVQLNSDPVADGVLGVIVGELHYICEATKNLDNAQNAPKAYSALEKVLNECESIDTETAAKIREIIAKELI